MEAAGFRQIPFRQLCLLQRRLWAPQLEHRISEAEMRLTVVGAKGNRLAKILFRSRRHAHVVPNVPTIHIAGGHLRVVLERACERIHSLLMLSVVSVYVSGDER